MVHERINLDGIEATVEASREGVMITPEEEFETQGQVETALAYAFLYQHVVGRNVVPDPDELEEAVNRLVRHYDRNNPLDIQPPTELETSEINLRSGVGYRKGLIEGETYDPEDLG